MSVSLTQARLKVSIEGFADGHGDTLLGSFQLLNVRTYRIVHERILND